MRDSRCYCVVLVVIFFSSLFQVGCSSSGATGAMQSATVAATPYEKAVDFDLSSSSSINWGASIAISNKGSDSLTMPAVFVKGGSALNRSSILSVVQTGGSLSDEQFALATWHLVVKNNFHSCSAGSPGDPSEITFDPMRLLNGYGFSCCDQSSRILNWLWQGAGYQARIAQMSFHTVPEIYYKGAWHMFDVDHKVYYLETDNKTIASVADLIADPSLVARAEDKNGNDPAGFSAKLMASLYAAATPSYFTVDSSGAQSYSLQPGQSFTIQYGNLASPVFHGPWPLPSGSFPVSSGRFDWSIDFSSPNWNTLPSSQGQVTTLSEGSDIFLTNAGPQSGFVIYELSSPFPVVSLQVSGLVYRSDSNAAINAYFSPNDTQWSTAFPLISAIGSLTSTIVDLGSAPAGQYSYFVKLELSGDAANTARIADVHIVSTVQDSIFVFPTLVPGQVNHLTYQDWSPASADHNVQVSLSGQ
jgi:hypothetical protein